MTAPLPADDGPVAIVCGGGSFPAAVAEALARRGRGFILLALRGWADPGVVERYPHRWVGIGRFGEICRLARRHGCRDVVFIGTVFRPAVSQLRPDLAGLRQLPRVIGLLRRSDDALLSGLGRIFEEHGFRLRGAHEVAPDILIQRGVLGRHRPGPRDEADIRHARELLQATGPFDIGQATVIADGRVLAVEAAEGTDLMLERLADLRNDGRVRTPIGTGVLVKAPKPNQDRRYDLPSIGPATVSGASRAGLAGIAVVAGATIVAEPAAVIAAADRAGLFVVGVDEATP